MSEDFKSNFVTADIDKPMLELEELNNQVKRKKAEIRKAMFYQKHPDLLQAKRDYEAKMSTVNTEKFNEAIAEPKQVKEVQEPEPQVQVQKPAIQATVPVSMVVTPPPQHVVKPLVVGLNAKWF
jgi:hypothetical protein